MMQRLRGGLSAAIVLVCAVTAAHASVLDTAGDNLEVSLVTYGPGTVAWERFGHDAIRLRDRNSGESVDFNFGVFDFQDSDFAANFARGTMQYMIDIEHSEAAQQDYIDAGRSVMEQQLALSPSQAAALRSLLIWDLRPENEIYDYDYLINNCATRIRDALDSVLGGAVRAALVARPADMTYRQQIDRLMSADFGLMLVMDLGLGPSADDRLNLWQESFLPAVLARQLAIVQLPDGHGGLMSMVLKQREVAANRLTSSPKTPPGLFWPVGLAGFTLAASMLALRPRHPALYATVVVAYLIFAGVVGTLLLALWTVTTHHAAWQNCNLLLFNPLALVVLAAAWRSRYCKDYGRRFPRALVCVQLGATLLAWLLHLLPGTVQQNLPWLLFATPAWLVITTGLFRDSPPVRTAETKHRRPQH